MATTQNPNATDPPAVQDVPGTNDMPTGFVPPPPLRPYPPSPPPLYIPPYPPPWWYVKGEWSLSFADLHWELIDPTAIRVLLRINLVYVDVAVLGAYQQNWKAANRKVGGTTVSVELEAVVPTGLQLGMLRVKLMTVENGAVEGTVSVEGIILQMWTPEGIPYPYPHVWPPSPPPGRRPPDGVVEETAG